MVFSSFTAEGRKGLTDRPELSDLRTDVETLNGQVVEQHYLLGKHDVMTIIDLPDAESAHRLSHSSRAKRKVLPIIDQNLFNRLLDQSTETTGPHTWQIRLPARVARLALRRSTYTEPIRAWCKPFTVVGGSNLDDLRGPAVFIANHASHLDSAALYNALPRRYQRRLTFGAAADRFYIKGRKGIKKQGWWYSIASNTFPIKRGAGKASLSHAEWLLARGWSVVIFPEGGRSSNGRLARFRVGPALIALSQNVPVVPMYMEGLASIRPKGKQAQTAGPVVVRIGAPLRFSAGTTPSAATHAMEKAVEALRREVHVPRRDVPAASPALTPTGGPLTA